MSQQLHEVDVTAAVEPLWKLQTPGVDVAVLHFLDIPKNRHVLAIKDQILEQVTSLRENDLKIKITK